MRESFFTAVGSLFVAMIVAIMMIAGIKWISTVQFHVDNNVELRQIIEYQNLEIEDLKKQILVLESEITRTAYVKVTFYAPKLRGINSDSDHTKTAIMDKPVPGWTCAISRDLVELGWLGRKIYIKGLGIRYASDIMGESFGGQKIERQIDICVGKKDVLTEAKKFGNNIDILATVL
jgi:3D (Asp-Asp-Asp) domain-containing protein